MDYPSLPTHIPAPWANWFVGFFDGEGCFLLAKQQGRIDARISIVLREDDEEILREVEQVTRGGNINAVSKDYDGPNSRDQYVWRVSHNEELKEKIIPIFEYCPPKSKKRQEYRVWKECFETIYELPSSEERKEETYPLRKNLHQIRNY